MGVKNYFKRQFQPSMFGLDYESTADFYVSCFQRNRSSVPLLCIRLILFLGCLGIVLASTILTSRSIGFGMWFVFLTHWGLLLITVTAGLGFAVSVRAYLRGPIDGTFGLPWYVKAYWVSYNVSIPIAFFITLFYWVLLTGTDEEYAINKVLDVFIHGINSVLMLILLITGRHPTRILHFYIPVLTGIIYLIFSLFYYLAGGLGPFGTGTIYPMLDWTNAVLMTITVIGSTIVIIIMHLVMVCFTAARDALSKSFRENSSSFSIPNDRW